VLESRRRRALALLEQGLSFNAAARRPGCAPSSVMRWARALVGVLLALQEQELAFPENMAP